MDKVLWEPTAQVIEKANITAYISMAREARVGIRPSDVFGTLGVVG